SARLWLAADPPPQSTSDASDVDRYMIAEPGNTRVRWEGEARVMHSNEPVGFRIMQGQERAANCGGFQLRSAGGGKQLQHRIARELADRARSHHRSALGIGLVVALDLFEIVEVVHHQAVRLA